MIAAWDDAIGWVSEWFFRIGLTLLLLVMVLGIPVLAVLWVFSQ